MLLRLQLGSHKLMFNILHATDAGEGHLLFDIVSEPIGTNGVAKNGRNNGTEEQPAIEHRLERETLAKGERCAPVGTNIAHTGLLAEFRSVEGTVLEFCEVVGQVSILCLET